jgi:hypothetical protein
MTTPTPAFVPPVAGTGGGREYVSHCDWFDALPEPDRAYPVVLEYTQRRVVLVDAESAEGAHRIVADCPYEYWPDDADADDHALYDGADGGIWVDRDPSFDLGRHLSYHQFAYGPLVACPDCGRTAHSVHPDALGLINHGPGCPRLVHRVTVTAGTRYDARTRDVIPGGWLVRCNCGGPDPTGRKARPGDPPTGTVVADRDTAVDLARAHVAGRLHAANPALGIPDRRTPDTPEAAPAVPATPAPTPARRAARAAGQENPR